MYGGRVEINRVQFDAPHPGGQDRTYSSRTAAQIDYYVSRLSQSFSLLYEKPGSLPGHENSGIQLNTQAAEFRPSDNMLKREPGDSELYPLGQLG
ncbi:hypothetical protein GCM10023310_17930 [Paenibacillus vulneris]